MWGRLLVPLQRTTRCPVSSDSLVAVYVKWFDASYQRGECDESDLIDHVVLHSFGILIRESETSYSIAMDQYDADRTWRYIEHIPKVNVLSIQRVEFRKEEIPVKKACGGKESKARIARGVEGTSEK